VYIHVQEKFNLINPKKEKRKTVNKQKKELLLATLTRDFTGTAEGLRPLNLGRVLAVIMAAAAILLL
jgi:hypothetical protein